MGVKEADRTHYVVLWQPANADRHSWTIMVDLHASSASEAIKLAAGDDPNADASGTYVAVPARSWKPMRVEQVQTVQTVITAADDRGEDPSADITAPDGESNQKPEAETP